MALAAQSGGAAFEIVDRVVEGGHDPRRFLGDLLERMRDLVILNAVPDAGAKGLISAPADRLARMTEQATSFGQAELSRAADLASVGLTEMRGATAPRLLLELVFARILLPGGEESARSLAARLERLERFGPPAGASSSAAAPAGHAAGDAGSGAAPPAGYAADQAQAADAAQPQPQQPAANQSGPSLAPPPWRTPPAAPASSAPQQQSAPSAAAAPSGPAVDVGAIRARWEEVLDRIRAQSRVAWTMVSADNAHVVGVEGRTIQLGFKIPTLRQNFPGSKYEDTLRVVLGQVFGGEWRVDVIVDPSVGHSGSGGSGSGPSQPAQAPPGGGGGGGGGQWGAPAAPQQPPQQQGGGQWAGGPGSVPQPSPQPPQPDSRPAASAVSQQPQQAQQPSGPGLMSMPGGGASGGVAVATATMAPPASAADYEPPGYAEMAPVPSPSPPPSEYDFAPPAFVEEPSDEGFDPHFAALNDEAAPMAPGPAARDLLIKELGANILEEIQNTD